MATITNRQIPAKITAREMFKANSVQALPSNAIGIGYAHHLTAEQRSELEQSSYVVYSYDTPIAWTKADGSLFLDGRKYSATTSRHQSLVRHGMSTDEFAAHKAQNPKVWR